MAEIKKCKKCKNKAKYKMHTVFNTDHYFCGVHIRKWTDNICAVITDLTLNQEDDE